MIDIKYLLLIAIIAGLMLCFGLVHADDVMDIPIKCEYHRSKVREIQKQFTERIFAVWRSQGDKTDALKLYDQADFTAWQILRDNGIICRHRK